MRGRCLPRAAVIVVVLAGLLGAAACGNSKSGTSTTTQPAGGSTTPPTSGSATDLTKHVSLPGVKGVTDSTIRVAAITSKTNPIGLNYHTLVDGMQAYFDLINSQGGIYGRKIEIVNDRDDNGLQNTQAVTASLSDDNAFATFVATLVFSGADLLAKAKQPSFVLNIDPAFASTSKSDHSNIFGNVPALCFSCPGPLLSWIALQNNFTKVGIVGYGVSAQSKQCAQGNKEAITHYTDGKVQIAFYDESLPYLGDVAADVAKMKQNGVQLVTTCLDNNEVVKLQKEMKKQGLDAVQVLPNAYDHDFVASQGALFEGSFVGTLNAPWETNPQSPATQQYLTEIKKVTSHPIEHTEVGWILAMEFVDGLKGAGPEFSQQKVIDYLNAQTAYSAQGLIAPIDWTKGHIDPQTHPEVRAAEQCQGVVEIKSSKFVLYAAPPDKPWICLDQSKSADQTPQFKSFAPGGQG
jgi:ABC-type branched-subunit amino acid transport system substrate-binding protein